MNKKSVSLRYLEETSMYMLFKSLLLNCHYRKRISTDGHFNLHYKRHVDPLLETKYEPRREKTCHWGFEPGKAHTCTGTLILETMQGFEVSRAIIPYLQRSTT